MEFSIYSYWTRLHVALNELKKKYVLILCKGVTERFFLILVPNTCFQTPCVTERFFLISVPNTYIARQRLIFQTVSNNLDLDTWGMQLVRCWQKSRLQVWDCLNSSKPSFRSQVMLLKTSFCPERPLNPSF